MLYYTGNRVQHFLATKSGLVRACDFFWLFYIKGGNHVPDYLERFGLIFRKVIGDSGHGAVHGRTSELLPSYNFAGGCLDQGRAAKVDVA